MRNLYRIEEQLRILSETTERATKAHILALYHLLSSDSRYKDPKRLLPFASRTYSQNGEDGMIAEIFRRIGAGQQTFAEVGVGDGLQSNTTYLLTKGWKGWWFEADVSAVSRMQRFFQNQIRAGSLHVSASLVTAENIETLLCASHVPMNVDLLSIDVDRNTYWIWHGLTEYRPRVVVIEYNASFPPDIAWTVEYKSDKFWNETSYFGASLKAFELLGRSRGYSLVGCDFTGTNAFFVQSSLCTDRFAEPFTSENHYEPPRIAFRLAFEGGHPPGVSD